MRKAVWIVAALVAAFGVAIATERLSSDSGAVPRPRRSYSPAADPSASLQPDNDQVAANRRPIWPGVRRPTSACPRHGAGSWRRDPQLTAAHFAAQLLGWRAAAVDQPYAANAFGDLNAVIRRSPTKRRGWHGAITVSMSTKATRCWWVLHVSGWGAGDPRVVRRGRRVVIIPQRPAPAVDVLAFLETETIHRHFRSRRTKLVLRDVPTEPGALILRFRNAAGEVFSAAGVPLPVGSVNR